MSKPFKLTVGRGSAADVRVPPEQDAVGKVHLEIADAGAGKVRITDLQSANGTFVLNDGQWEEIKGVRILPIDAEIMLGDYRTTPRFLLGRVVQGSDTQTPKPKYVSAKEEPPPPKRTGPRRNEFGEIVYE